MTEMRTWLTEIPMHECVALLSKSWVGRLALDAGGHPDIFPVNHVVDARDSSILFPTRVGTKLHAALRCPIVAFEVDGIDPDDGSGWSVVLLGRAELLSDEDTIAWATARRAAPWAIHEQSQWLRIRPVQITGRRIFMVA